MPLNASQLHPKICNSPSPLYLIEPEYQAQAESIQAVIDYDELTRHKIDDCYRNAHISYIYSNYFGQFHETKPGVERQ